MKLFQVKLLFILLFCLLNLSCNQGEILFDETINTSSKDNNLKILNQTDFTVCIFSDSMHQNKIVEISKYNEIYCFQEIISTGNIFYLSYFLDVNGILIPYGTGSVLVKLEEKKITNLRIPEPENINKNANVVLLENSSTSSIILKYKNIELFPENSNSSLLSSDKYGVYLLDNTPDITQYSISVGSTEYPLYMISESNFGYIYSFKFNGSETLQLAKIFFDKSLEEKNWKINVSNENSKNVRISSLFSSQGSYSFYGNLSYSPLVQFNYSYPYYAYIDSESNIIKEEAILFSDNPKNCSFVSAINGNSIHIALGNKTNQNYFNSCFIMSDNYGIYEEIITSNLDFSYSAFEVIYKKENCFIAVLAETNNETKEEKGLLYEIIINGYGNCSISKIWESSNQSFIQSCAYDENNDTYIILSQGAGESFSSIFTFVDANTGLEKLTTLELPRYVLNKIKFNSLDGYVYSSGSYLNPINNKDNACLVKIDSSTGSLVNESSIIYPASSNLNSNFNDFIINEKEILLCGFIDADYDKMPNYSDSYPYIVSYNTETKTTNWEKKYALKGYYVKTVARSEINSLLMLLESPGINNSFKTLIVSTGLLGDLPQITKNTLPETWSVSAPNIKIYIGDGSEDHPSKFDTYYEIPYGNTLSFNDLKPFWPQLENGYAVGDWISYNWTLFPEETVAFPRNPCMDFFLYPKIKIAPPENLSAKILSSTKILLTWDSNPIASKYEVYLNGNLLHTLSSNSLNVEGLTPGEVSSYTIRAYDSEKNEYSNFSDKLDIQTYIPSTGYFDQIPTNSFELNEDTSSYLFNLYGNKISFNLFCEADAEYKIRWADSSDGTNTFINTFPDEKPVKDIQVSIYRAGEENLDNYIVKEIDNGFTNPVTFIPVDSGYYVIEVISYENNSGYFYLDYSKS